MATVKLSVIDVKTGREVVYQFGKLEGIADKSTNRANTPKRAMRRESIGHAMTSEVPNDNTIIGTGKVPKKTHA
jgi:hypothetical protein